MAQRAINDQFLLPPCGGTMQDLDSSPRKGDLDTCATFPGNGSVGFLAGAILRDGVFKLRYARISTGDLEPVHGESVTSGLAPRVPRVEGNMAQLAYPQTQAFSNVALGRAFKLRGGSYLASTHALRGLTGVRVETRGGRQGGHQRERRMRGAVKSFGLVDSEIIPLAQGRCDRSSRALAGSSKGHQFNPFMHASASSFPRSRAMRPLNGLAPRL
eukprot:1305620-Amorphochlora_amoeboformis.AAC.1